MTKSCKYHFYTERWKNSNMLLKYRWNGTYQLQNSANSKENGQNIAMERSTHAINR